MKVEDLKPGAIVRAITNLDKEGANVKRGDIGVVFGSANCYGDNAGPIIHWFRAKNNQVILGGVCNIYAGQVEILFYEEHY
jgi:hypothetical protein